MLQKTTVRIAILLVLGLALMSAALVMAEESTPARQQTAQDGDMPGADGQEILDYVLDQNLYADWGAWDADRWTDFGGYLQSGAPHGETVRIFVNNVALDAAAADDFDGTLPPGSLVVKENFGGSVDEPGDLAALTIMYKVEGFNPDANDWFWVKAAGDGSAIDAEGAVEGCIGCHSQDGNADYLLRYAFGDEPAAYYGEPLPEDDGDALLTYLLDTAPYTEWGTWPAQGDTDYTAYLPSGAPHGNTVRIFVNNRALDAIERDNFDGTLPNGSIVVKENFGGSVDEPGELAALTVMYKLDGFNPDAHDWFWLKAAGDGSAVDAAGAVEGCIGCHGQEGNSDYLLRYDLPEGADMDGDMDGGDMGGGLDGEALVQERCSVCHGLDRVNSASKDEAGWTSTVDRMISKGANLNEDERAAVIEYLASQ
jgi:cytochrome c553